MKKIGFFLAPALFLVILLLPQMEALSVAGQRTLAVAVWMIVWWITEAVDLAVTALLPIVLFPLLGISTIDQATAPYGNQVIYLFLGGFVIATALEKWNLHTRLALTIVKMTGTNADGIVLGFLLSSGLVSMWISNTATTVMILPIALSVINLLRQHKEPTSLGMRNFAMTMTLAVAYGANIGGIATLVGTPPNSVMAGLLNKLYGYQMSFGGFMLVGLPFSLALLLATYIIMVKWIYPNRLGRFEGAGELIRAELAKLGPASVYEKRVVWFFGGAAFLWVSRSYINSLLPWLKLTDTGIAVAAAIACFLGRKPLLEWKDMQRMPWGILLLFGGGLSLADGLERSGIIALIGQSVSQYQGLPFFAVTMVLSAIVLFLTELLSNVALITVFVPMVAAMAVGMGQNPLLVVVPLTMASSCAFMLPMGTPPNAIVFAGGYIKVQQMVRVGFWLNMIALVLLALVVQVLLPVAFDTRAPFSPLR